MERRYARRVHSRCHCRPERGGQCSPIGPSSGTRRPTGVQLRHRGAGASAQAPEFGTRQKEVRGTLRGARSLSGTPRRGGAMAEDAGANSVSASANILFPEAVVDMLRRKGVIDSDDHHLAFILAPPDAADRKSAV